MHDFEGKFKDFAARLSEKKKVVVFVQDQRPETKSSQFLKSHA
jgi:hypothetical protein